MISFVVPVFNEEETLSNFNSRMTEVANTLEDSWEIIYIDDGSTDDSLNNIKNFAKNEKIRFISFSRNFGKEAGILAGLNHAKGDIVGVLDADLQHPPEIIPEMLKYLDEGYDVVATKRKNRKSTGSFYNFGAKTFYKIINGTGKGVKLTPGVQDFRVMKREVVDSILSLREKTRFSKGIFNWVGFNTKYIGIRDYKRAGGKSKWNFFDSLKYGLDGIISFSTAPLDLSILMGTVLSAIGFIYAIYIVIKTLVLGKDVPGFATIVCLLLLIGGINLVFLGVIGSYIGRIYEEVKNRPSYIIKESSDIKEELPFKDD